VVLSDEAKRNQLMGALADHALVKAAVVVDRNGGVKARIGSALSLKAGSTDQFVATSAPKDQVPKENVYLVGAGADFLIAIFDEGVDFDSVKKDVDSLIEQLEV
jgi:hypothetical protein